MAAAAAWATVFASAAVRVSGGAKATPSLLERTMIPLSRVAMVSLSPMRSAGSIFGFGLLVRDHLDQDHQALATDVADVARDRRAVRAVRRGAHTPPICGVGGEILVLDDLDVAAGPTAQATGWPE